MCFTARSKLTVRGDKPSALYLDLRFFDSKHVGRGHLIRWRACGVFKVVVFSAVGAHNQNSWHSTGRLIGTREANMSTVGSSWFVDVSVLKKCCFKSRSSLQVDERAILRQCLIFITAGQQYLWLRLI